MIKGYWHDMTLWSRVVTNELAQVKFLIKNLGGDGLAWNWKLSIDFNFKGGTFVTGPIFQMIIHEGFLLSFAPERSETGCRSRWNELDVFVMPVNWKWMSAIKYLLWLMKKPMSECFDGTTTKQTRSRDSFLEPSWTEKENRLQLFKCTDEIDFLRKRSESEGYELASQPGRTRRGGRMKEPDGNKVDLTWHTYSNWTVLLVSWRGKFVEGWWVGAVDFMSCTCDENRMSSAER